MEIPAASLELDVSIALQNSPGKLGVTKRKGFTKKTERKQKNAPNKETKKNPKENQNRQNK